MVTYATPVQTQHAAPGPAPRLGMIWVPGNSFMIGSNDHYPGETPVHRVTVNGFWIDARPVTNTQFRRFVRETGYATVAELAPDPTAYPGAPAEALVPGSAVFCQPPHPVSSLDPYAWWAWVPGADGRHPGGPESSLHNRLRHLVVHVTNEDAAAYAAWAGKGLPTEAEWGYAARGGLDGTVYAWGNDFTPHGQRMANTWQGEFPHENLATDGFVRTSPVGTFPPNGFGLFDMIGNVWEWTTDWYGEHPVSKSCCGSVNPRGGPTSESHDSRLSASPVPRKVIKGGSFLCAPNYCQRYRPAARLPQPIDTATCHLGLRCVVRDRG